MTSLVPIGGMMADYLRKNNIMSTTTVRKLFNCGGFGLEAFFFVLVAYANNKVNTIFYKFFTNFLNLVSNIVIVK